MGDAHVTCPNCDHELAVPVDTEVLPREPDATHVKLAVIPRLMVIHDHAEVCNGGC